MTFVIFRICFGMAHATTVCYILAAYAQVSELRTQNASTMIDSKKIKRTIAIVCFPLLTLGAFGQAAHDKDKDKDDPQATKLIVLEHLWNEAQVNRDQRALEGMIADSFVDTEWDGDVSERGKFLADIKDPQFKPTLVTIQDLKVNLYHNAGVVTGVYHTKGSYNGKPYEHLGRFTDTWIFADGKWECVASHTSLLKK
jgi:Domain of unknown function (DUF4440)